MMKEVHKYTFIFGCGSKQMVMSNHTTSEFKIRNSYWGQNRGPDSLVVQSSQTTCRVAQSSMPMVYL